MALQDLNFLKIKTKLQLHKGSDHIVEYVLGIEGPSLRPNFSGYVTKHEISCQIAIKLARCISTFGVVVKLQ